MQIEHANILTVEFIALLKAAPIKGVVADCSELPAPRSLILEAILNLIAYDPIDSDVPALQRLSYALTRFQPGVGRTRVSTSEMRSFYHAISGDVLTVQQRLQHALEVRAERSAQNDSAAAKKTSVSRERPEVIKVINIDISSDDVVDDLIPSPLRRT